MASERIQRRIERLLDQAEEACERYRLSAEELLNWEQLIAAHGLRGLKVSRIHEYRQSEREDNPAQRLLRDGMSRDATDREPA